MVEGKLKKNGFGKKKNWLTQDAAPVEEFLYNVHIGCAYINMACKLFEGCFDCLNRVSESFPRFRPCVLST